MCSIMRSLYLPTRNQDAPFQGHGQCHKAVYTSVDTSVDTQEHCIREALLHVCLYTTAILNGHETIMYFQAL